MPANASCLTFGSSCLTLRSLDICFIGSLDTFAELLSLHGAVNGLLLKKTYFWQILLQNLKHSLTFGVILSVSMSVTLYDRRSYFSD